VIARGDIATVPGVEKRGDVATGLCQLSLSEADPAARCPSSQGP